MSLKSKESDGCVEREPGYRWRRDHETPLQFVEPEMLVDQSRADGAAMIEDMMRELDRLLSQAGARRPVRLVVYLLLAGWTIREIAKRLDVTVYVVRRRLGAARVLLLQSGVVESAKVSPAAEATQPHECKLGASPIHTAEVRARNRYRHPRRLPAPALGGIHRWKGPDADRSGQRREDRDANRPNAVRSRAPLYSVRPAPWVQPCAGDRLREVIFVCRCCEARLRPLTPAQSFGWREVYDSESHRHGGGR